MKHVSRMEVCSNVEGDGSLNFVGREPRYIDYDLGCKVWSLKNESLDSGWKFLEDFFFWG